MKIRSSLSAVALACLAWAGQAQAATSWEQYQGNAQHTGYSNVFVHGTLSQAWTKNFGTGLNPVAAADGSVFVTTQGYFSGQHLFALNATTGNVNWSKNFGSVHSVNPPSYSNGSVYLQTGNHGSDSYFRGYDAKTGDLKVKVPFSAQWERYQAPTLFKGNAYANGGYYGGAYSFSLDNGGATRWFTGLEQYDGWTPAVNDKYVVTYTGGNLRVLDHDTGAVKQTITDPHFSWNGWTSGPAPVLAGDQAFATSSGYLTNFNLTTGAIDWSLSGVSGQIAIDGNEIFAIRNGTLSSINADSGLINWMWEDPASSSYSFEVLATRNLVFVAGAYQTYVIDRLTHKTVQTLNETGHFALGNDQFYIASSTGTLSAYNLPAIPEAGSVAMVVCGLGVVAMVRRRRTPRNA